MLALLGLPDVTPAAAGHVLQAVTGSSLDPSLILGTFLVVAARLIGFMMVGPFFGSMNIPMPVRVAFAVVLSFVLSPLLMDTVAPALISAKADGIGQVAQRGALLPCHVHPLPSRILEPSWRASRFRGFTHYLSRENLQ